MYAYGWCRGIEDAEWLRQLGFDYIECAVTSLSLEDESAFRKILPSYQSSPLPVRVLNTIFPGDMKIVGPDADAERIRQYLAKAAYALHSTGARTVVLGSGASRNVPDGWSRERAEEQFARLLEWMDDEFDGTGVTVAIEPLNKKETNLINRISEAVNVARQVNRQSIRVLTDFFHMMEEDESLDTLVEHKEWLAHIHVADTGRFSPGTGHYPYDLFVLALQKAGYSGLVSAECLVSNPEAEIPAGLKFIKSQFEPSTV